MKPKDIKKILCQCSECKQTFDSEAQETLNARHINPYTKYDRIVCDQCFDSLWDECAIICCENCGEWFDNKLIHSADVGGELFALCPNCGHDVVEGISRKEFIKEYSEDEECPEDDSPHNYAVTISYPDGENVTYLFANAVEASAFCDQFEKDMRDSGANVASSSAFGSVVNFQTQSADGHCEYTKMIFSRIYQ